ncbi:MAG TPA: hypothetical protein PKD85_01795, partial [Saprospiraceae bacterium]|nr:hypothetical protein [Saprospiraceae bacterium]
MISRQYTLIINHTKMYKITIIIIFIFGVYIVNGQDKNISFVIKNAGINVDGHFDKYTAHISYNEN